MNIESGDAKLDSGNIIMRVGSSSEGSGGNITVIGGKASQIIIMEGYVYLRGGQSNKGPEDQFISRVERAK